MIRSTGSPFRSAAGRDDPRELLSMHSSRAINLNWRLTRPHVLYSNRSNRMWEIEEDLTAESHILRVGIAMDHQFTDGLARMAPLGSLWVPLQCDRVYTDRMYVDPCELELSRSAPGVLDGSCKAESSDEFGPIHIGWTAHFAP